MYGSPEVTPGGRALKFYSSIRLDIRRIEAIKDGADVIGNRTRVKVVKNKCSAPFKQAEFDIMYGKGISREGSLLDVAVELGFIKKSGAWFTYEGEQLGQGRENVKTFLSENPQLMAEIDDRVRECLAPKDDGRREPDEAVTRPRRPADHARLLTASPASHTASKPPDRLPPLPRVTGPERFASGIARGPSSHNGAMPAGGVEATGLPRLRPCVPTVPFRYLPPKQSVRMAFNVILDREPDAGGRRRVRPEAGRRRALASRRGRGAGPLRGVPPPGPHRQRAALHARQPQRVRGRPAPGRPHPRPRGDPPGPARRRAGAPRLPLSLRATGGGRPPGRGARRDLPGRLDRRAGASPSSVRWSSPSTPWSISAATSDGSFDLVYSGQSIEHVTEAEGDDGGA